MSILLAFSGGLDTSFCVPYLREQTGREVHTLVVDTGGLRPGEAEAIRQRALSLGAASHACLDGRRQLWDDHLSYLVKGNVLRGSVYPLCVGPERVVQARLLVAHARALGVGAVAHGSTGAGNDAIRFDVALGVLAGELDVLTPIRDAGVTREASTAFLQARGFDVPASTTTYSVNRGLWGTTIGGAETLGSERPLPEDAYPDTCPPALAPPEGTTLRIGFEAGQPVALDGEAMEPVALVEHLNARAGAHGVGRGIHVGDTILGIKGRVGFEAPAPLVLVAAHRELEKIVLSARQRHHKDHLADVYGMLLHEGQYFDPVMRDVEALIDSSQQRVAGHVDVSLRQGHVQVLGCASPHTLFAPAVAAYGEQNHLWDGRDARGFARIAGVGARLAAGTTPQPSIPAHA